MFKPLLLLVLLAAPTSAFAEDVGTPQREARAITQQVSREFPEILERLRDEIANGLSKTDLICTNGDPLPCIEDSRPITPGGVEVGITEEGLIYPLVPKAGFRPEQGLLNRMASPGPRSDAAMIREQIREEGLSEDDSDDGDGGGVNVLILR